MNRLAAGCYLTFQHLRLISFLNSQTKKRFFTHLCYTERLHHYCHKFLRSRTKLWFANYYNYRNQKEETALLVTAKLNRGDIARHLLDEKQYPQLRLYMVMATH